MYIDLTWVIMAGLLATFFWKLYRIYDGVKKYQSKRKKP